MNTNPETEILLKAEVFRIMGACFEVYNQMGFGLSETIYQDCIELELTKQGIPFISQQPIILDYKGHRLPHHFIPDLVCFGKILIELKSVKTIADEHRAQLINYLRISQMQVGVLVNFGAFPKLEWERLVNTKSIHSRSLA